MIAKFKTTHPVNFTVGVILTVVALIILTGVVKAMGAPHPVVLAMVMGFGVTFLGGSGLACLQESMYRGHTIDMVTWIFIGVVASSLMMFAAAGVTIIFGIAQPVPTILALIGGGIWIGTIAVILIGWAVSAVINQFATQSN